MKRFVLATFVIPLAAAFACSQSTGDTPPAPDAGPDVATDTSPPAPAWTPVLQALDGALLSMWGTSEKDIWTVGGSLGNGGPTLALHFDGTTWKNIPAGGPQTFWWVNGTNATDVWMVGEEGRIAHWNGSAFEEKTSGTTATLYGVWAAAPNDVWAVGGTPDEPTQPNDVLLHWDGSAWSPVTLPVVKNVALFKVWGSSADDVYVVGEAGVIWHLTGGTWSLEGAGVATGRLTTVTGCSKSEIIAVGGRDLLTSDGAGHWTRSAMLLANDVNGVSCAPAGAPPQDYGRAVIVGGGSLKLRLVGTTWQNDFGTMPYADLHGAWVDPTGAFWGVGGAFNDTPHAGASRAGVIARFGAGTVPSTLSQ